MPVEFTGFSKKKKKKNKPTENRNKNRWVPALTRCLHLSGCVAYCTQYSKVHAPLASAVIYFPFLRSADFIKCISDQVSRKPCISVIRMYHAVSAPFPQYRWGQGTKKYQKQIASSSYLAALVSFRDRSTDILSLTYSLKDAAFHPLSTSSRSETSVRTPSPRSPGPFGSWARVLTS